MGVKVSLFCFRRSRNLFPNPSDSIFIALLAIENFVIVKIFFRICQQKFGDLKTGVRMGLAALVRFRKNLGR
jgi:hypothetical protein